MTHLAFGIDLVRPYPSQLPLLGQLGWIAAPFAASESLAGDGTDVIITRPNDLDTMGSSSPGTIGSCRYLLSSRSGPDKFSGSSFSLPIHKLRKEAERNRGCPFPSASGMLRAICCIVHDVALKSRRYHENARTTVSEHGATEWGSRVAAANARPPQRA